MGVLFFSVVFDAGGLSKDAFVIESVPELWGVTAFFSFVFTVLSKVAAGLFKSFTLMSVMPVPVMSMLTL